MNRISSRGALLKRMLGAAALALSAGATQAAVIGFEGQSGPAYNGRSFQEAGYTVSFQDPGGDAPAGTVLIGRFIDGADAAACAPSTCPTNNPTTYFDLFNSGLIDVIAAPTGSSFRFSSLDASFIATPGLPSPAVPAALQVFGLRADNSVAVIQFDIPDMLAFKTYNAADAANGAAFAASDFVEIGIVGFHCDASGACNGLDNGPGQIGIDNIVLSDLPSGRVPEPATLALLAVGLLGLPSPGRRRRG